MSDDWRRTLSGIAMSLATAAVVVLTTLSWAATVVLASKMGAWDWSLGSWPTMLTALSALTLLIMLLSWWLWLRAQARLAGVFMLAAVGLAAGPWILS